MSIRIHPHGDGISFDEPEQREGKIRNQWANEKKILHMGYPQKSALGSLIIGGKVTEGLDNKF